MSQPRLIYIIDVYFLRRALLSCRRRRHTQMAGHYRLLSSFERPTMATRESFHIDDFLAVRTSPAICRAPQRAALFDDIAR